MAEKLKKIQDDKQAGEGVGLPQLKALHTFSWLLPVEGKLEHCNMVAELYKDSNSSSSTSSASAFPNKQGAKRETPESCEQSQQELEKHNEVVQVNDAFRFMLHIV